MKNGKILLIDDNDDHRDAVHYLLKNQNYTVLSDRKGKDALKRLMEHDDIRVLIVDLAMLDLSGIDILKGIKNYQHPLRRIVLTAYGEELSVEEAGELNVFAFLTKPVEKHSLLYTVKLAFNDIRLKELTHKSDAFREITRLLINSNNIQEILNFIAEKSLELLKGYTCHIRTVEEETRSLVLRSGKGPYMRIAENRKKIGNYITGKVAQTGKPEIIKKLQDEEYFKELKKTYMGDKKTDHEVQNYFKTAKSAIVIPIKRDQKVIGIINMTGDKENHFGKTELETLQNIADQASIAITIAETQKKLIEKEKFSTLGTVMGELSHVIENEAAKIRFKLLDIISEISKNDPKRSELESILDRAQYLIDIKQNLASPLVEIQAEKIVIEGLKKGIKILIENLKKEFEKEKIVVEINFPGKLPPVYGDETRLLKVFDHLIKNSFEATKSIGGILKISASTEESGGFVNILFEDTGKGILEKFKEKLFASFFSTKIGGLGYGLWYCKQTMLNMKGDVLLLESSKDEGATFCVKIPVYKED